MITFFPHTRTVTALAFSPDGSALASVSDDCWAKVWERTAFGTDAALRWQKRAHERGVNHCMFAPTGELITGGTDGRLVWWSADRGEPLREFLNGSAAAGHPSVNVFVLSPGGERLAWGGGFSGNPTDAYVAPTGSPEGARREPAHSGAIRIMASFRDGFCTGGLDRNVRFWDWKMPGYRTEMKLRGGVRGMAATPDGTRLAVAGGAVVTVYELTRPRPFAFDVEKPRPLRGHTRRVECLEFSPDARLLASAALDGTLRVWDVATGQAVRVFTPRLGPLHWAAFAPDGLTLAFSSRHGHVGLLDLDD